MAKNVWFQMLVVTLGFGAPLCSQAAFAAELEKPNVDVMATGKELVVKNCAHCHAIEKDDVSQHAEAPPFRQIASRYSVWLLAESLAEGIVSGHPDMPEFVFEPPEIHAILSYMDSLKDGALSTP